jgi:hypothetical protein
VFVIVVDCEEAEHMLNQKLLSITTFLGCLKGMNPLSPGFFWMRRIISSISSLADARCLKGFLFPFGDMWQGEQVELTIG